MKHSSKGQFFMTSVRKFEKLQPKGQFFIRSQEKGGDFEKLQPKGQFFIISTIVVAFTLVGIQFLFAGYNIADPSLVFTFQEDYTFWNVRDALNKTFHGTSCPTLERNLHTIKADVEQRLRQRHILFSLRFSDPCGGAGDATKQSTDFALNLTSFNYRLFDEFRLAP